MITIKRKFLLLRVFYSAINLGLIFLLILPSSCFSQKTDTIDLHEISVSPRYATHFHKKNALRVIDSIFIQSQAASSMAQVLQNDNSLYVKSYGPSGSAVS